MLTAVGIVCNIFTIVTGVKYFAISFAYIPAFLAGTFINPLAGFAVGFIADLLGALIHPLGPYNPIINVSSGLLGLIPGVIFHFVKAKTPVKIVLSFVCTLIICTAGLNTYAIYLMGSKGNTYWAYLALRLPWQSLVSAMNMVIIFAIFKPLTVAYNKMFPELKKSEGKPDGEAKSEAKA